MPYPFFETPTTSDGIEQHTLACFDVAALLLRDFAPETFTPSLWSKGNGFLSRHDHAAVGGASLSAEPGEIYPLSGYQYLTAQKTRSDQESAIIMGFRALRRMAEGDPVNAGTAEAIVREKLADLQAKGLSLNGRVKPLVVHYVRTDRRYVGGEHIGLLIQWGGKCYFLEKNGPSGPFVLLQTDGQGPVIDYVDLHYDLAFRSDSQPDLVGSIMVVTLGSEVIRSIDYRHTGAAQPGAAQEPPPRTP